ncbi:hypothetical protein OIE66_37050 [Nonomuraea sp. NBC_01738]|uniref:hypothetical protein n=1 Tax=Nonomuraea sp. NBC_01738 TaxID=2976003 RepID=UPI002E14F144|nr:hypothetical protein OIE66_37050 [Nonomuraea sp. NBC_01738]
MSPAAIWSAALDRSEERRLRFAIFRAFRDDDGGIKVAGLAGHGLVRESQGEAAERSPVQEVRGAFHGAEGPYGLAPLPHHAIKMTTRLTPRPELSTQSDEPDRCLNGDAQAPDSVLAFELVRLDGDPIDVQDVSPPS